MSITCCVRSYLRPGIIFHAFGNLLRPEVYLLAANQNLPIQSGCAVQRRLPFHDRGWATLRLESRASGPLDSGTWVATGLPRVPRVSVLGFPKHFA